MQLLYSLQSTKQVECTSSMHLDHKRKYTFEPQEVLCTCLKVSRWEVEKTIDNINVFTIAELRKKCCAGGGCGSCHEELARLLLSRQLGRNLDFYTNCPIAGCEPCTARDLEEEIVSFVKEHINPMLAPLGCFAQIQELDEEVLLDIRPANQDVKYTLSFLIEVEFTTKFAGRVRLLLL